MRRFVFLLLLVVLPIQFGGSPALAYCGHEAGSSAPHPGHHEHQHNGATGDPKAASPASDDLDCGTCQSSGAPAILAAWSQGMAPVPGAPQFAYRVHCGQFIPSGPERPDRV